MPAGASPNHDARPAGTPIDMLVLHYTGMQSATAALERLCDPASRVSAHYMIDEVGEITPLVPEHRRAWHAGVSYWRGHRDVNGRSIGIELVNPGHAFGYRPFAEPQINALLELASRILDSHPIPARNVVGHSDVAPGRKQDPGELFPWHELSRAGIGLWPHAASVSERTGDLTDLFGQYGYDPELEPRLLIRAFQLHFRPERPDGVADAETTARLAGLLAALDVEGE